MAPDREFDDAGEANVGLACFEISLRRIKPAWSRLASIGEIQLFEKCFKESGDATRGFPLIFMFFRDMNVIEIVARMHLTEKGAT